MPETIRELSGARTKDSSEMKEGSTDSSDQLKDRKWVSQRTSVSWVCRWCDMIAGLFIALKLMSVPPGRGDRTGYLMMKR